MGKNTVLKSLIASQLVYILSTLPTNHRFINDVNNLFFKFLWSDRGDKVKRDVIISDYSNGGLKMIDLKSFNKALKSTWIKKNTLIQKTKVNGNSFLTLSYNSSAALLFSEETLRKTTCLNI